jgi:uncharacterized iron-regulated membrane protein
MSMPTALQIAATAGAPAVLSGIVIWWFARRMNRMDSQAECRRQETVLLLKGMLTIGGLASATARALKEGAANGYVTEALEDYSDYREKLSAFLVEQTAKKNN